MKAEIIALEQISRKLETNTAQRNALNEAVANYADAFISSLAERNAYDAAPNEAKEIKALKIEEAGKDLHHIMERYQAIVDTSGINPASPRHFGYIPGGGLFHTAIGDYIAAVGNRYAGMYFPSPGAVHIQNELIRWMCELIGYTNQQAFGTLLSGGSIANLTAITAARDCKNIRSKDVERAVVYLTKQVHHCVLKAMRIAGLQEAIVRKIPMDSCFKMRVSELAQQIAIDKANGLLPFLVVASAGTTDVGTIDPLDAIAKVAQQHELWYHVDAAYGGAFMLADVENVDGTNLRASFNGIEQADSVTIDPHKGFFVSYGLGALLVKDINSLYKTNYYQANYLQDTEGIEEANPSDLSPELSRHFRALRLWLPFQLLGTKPFAAALSEKVLLTRYFYEKVQKIGFEVGNYPELSVMIYRYIPEEGDANAYNEKLVQNIWKDGYFFVSTTTIDGIYWLRLAVVSFRTHLKDIDNYLAFLNHFVHKDVSDSTI